MMAPPQRREEEEHATSLSALGQACPQCGCPDLMDCVTYRKCPVCSWKDGLTPQEILDQREARP
jgi:hypothetical protein